MPSKKDVAVDVDDYIAKAPAAARPHLTELRDLFRAAVPQAEETISWGVPYYKYQGEIGGFDAFAKHVSFGIENDILDTERDGLEAKGYTLGKGTIQIPFAKHIPVTEITRMLEAKAALNSATKKQR